MNDPQLVSRFEGFCDLPRDRQRFVEGKGPARDPLGEILPLNEFHHKGADAVGFFEAVDLGDVWMVQ